MIHAQHHDSLFETFAYFVEKTRLSPDPLRVMRMDSLEAAAMFRGIEAAGGNIHFLFLDDDHEYAHLKRELEAWEPLMGKDSIIAGHDVTEEFHGVEEAVREHFGEGNYTVECGRSWVVRLK